MSERPGNALMPNLLTPQDLEPNWEWRDRLPAWATPRWISSAALITTGCAATGWPARGKRFRRQMQAHCCFLM